MDNAMKIVRSRLRLAASSGALILALSLGAGAARAQSFNATATPVLGAPTVSTGAGTTTITINAPETIIDWNGLAVPSASPFIFQNAGTTATFTNPISGPPLADYTVLNRIFLSNPALGLPSVLRAVQFNGTVTSLLNGNVQGNIWFYSPTGIIAGAGSVFNVGSLVLTTDAIDTTGGLYGPSPGPGQGIPIRFRGAAGSTGFVNVEAGASLNTTNNKVTSQYVALVAPRVVQGGTIQVDGQVALVAAEQADIFINNGLLDLVVSQGTSDANGIVHTGTTTGAATSSAANKQVIQMVAMPKNTALTMLLSGNIGYTPAALASNEGSTVVLSAGYGSYVPRATQALALGNMTIADATIRNALTANATDTIRVQPTATNAVNFQADASLTAGKQIDVIADDDSLIAAAGKLDLKSGFFETGGKVNVRAINTTAALPAGQITIGGDLTIDASAAADPTDPIAATSAAVSGGSVLLEAQRGTVSSAGLTINANARSADALTMAGNAGGGKIVIQTSGGGSLTAGTVDLQARGSGGNADVQGGRGSGGTIDLLDQGGALNFTTVSASAVGRGGVSNTATGRGGDGFGGAVTVDIQGNTSGWNSLNADASAFAGLPLTPGSHSGNAFAQNEAIRLHVGSGANFGVQGDILLQANATAGIDGTAGNTFADAGGIDVIVDGKASLFSAGATGATGNLVARADARVDAQSYRPDVLYTPNTFGGLVSVTADNGTIRLDHIYTSATAEGAGAATAAGQALGGAILVGAINGGQLNVTSTALGTPGDPFGSGNLTLDAGARGAAGPSSANATAGNATLYIQNGTISVDGTTTVRADAGASQFDGFLNGGTFTAKGGTATLESQLGTGTGSITLAAVTINANGTNDGQTGDGEGGTAQVVADGDLLSATSLDLTANGLGSGSGSGRGGLARISGSNAGTIRSGITNLAASGQGGVGLLNSGAGTGGTTSITETGASLDLGEVRMTANGTGGDSVAGGGTAGNGFGGKAVIDLVSDQPTWTLLEMRARSIVGEALGSGTTGGFAQGMSPQAIYLHLSNGAQLTVDSDVTLDASAIGAFNAPAGGSVTAGAISLLAETGSALTVLGRLNANATATMSLRGYSPAVATAPNLNGGAIDIKADAATLDLGDVRALAYAEGAGTGLASGTAQGGRITAGSVNGGLLSARAGVGPASFLLDAGARGSGGPAQSRARGGTATLYVQDGRVTIDGRADVLASAQAGSFDGLIGGPGFRADGGSANVEVRAGTGLGVMQITDLSVDASGLSTPATTLVQGNGGRGLGGVAAVQIDDSGFAVGSVLVRADGYGSSAGISNGPTAFTSGGGDGGVARLRVTGGSATVSGQLTLSAVGKGGGLQGPASDASLAANGGVGDGGQALINLTGGTLNLPGATTVLDARGIGGRGMDSVATFAGASGGQGGIGIGGTASLTLSRVGSVPLLTGSGFQIDGGGIGGLGGTSANGPNGLDGNGLGGRAELVVTDGQFALGNVALSADGTAGGASGTGSSNGLALFQVDDLLTATYATRTLGGLTLNSRVVGVAPTNGFGRTQLRARVTSPGSGVTIAGDLLFNIRARSDASASTVTLGGAPLTVNGNMTVNGSSVFGVSAGTGAPLGIAGRLTVSGVEQFRSDGLIFADLGADIQANTAIDMTDLISGADTNLHTDVVPGVAGGPVLMRNNLQSVGPVRAFGTAVDITSPGALTFTQAQATVGNLAIRTAGNLDATAVSATGTTTLTSTGGAIHATGLISGNGVALSAGSNVQADAGITSGAGLTVQAGGSFTAGAPVTAGGNVAIDAAQGITAARLTSGGTTVLTAANGAIAITTDLLSPGLVSASGRAVNLVSSGTLNFAVLTATAGDAAVQTVGSLDVTNASASGQLKLASTTGSVSSSGTLTGGGGATMQGATGVALNALQSGGATDLSAPGGALSVQALSSTGPVSALARSVTIQSPGALSFTTAQATAGNLSIQTAGNLDLPAVSATGSTSLTSTGGSIHATGAVTGNGVALTAGGSVLTDAGITSGGALTVQAGGQFTGGGTTSAAGNVSLTGAQGVTAPRIISGGTTVLSAANGAITVATDLTSPGAVTASGRSVSLVSSGALTFAGLTATAGDATVQASGGLTVPNASASGALSLTSSGGAVGSTGTLSSGGNLAVNGSTGVSLNTVQSGGTTSLQSALGNVTVAALTSAGAVSARGRAMSIQSPGALTFAQAQATAGDLLIRTAGDLALGAVDAGGAVTLTSTGGALAASGTITGNGVALSAATTLGTAAIQSGGALSATAGGNMSIGGDANAGTTLALTSTGGSLTTRRLGAAQIALASAGAMQIDGALSLGTLTARSGGLFRMRGLSSGTSIAITSADIDLGTFALGQRGTTQSITLTNGAPTGRTFVGGTDNQGGYTLSAAEALQLFADRQITINVAAGNATPADMVVGNLALTFGSNIGSGGTLKLDTAGRVVVQGAVQLRTVSAGDTFSIDPTQIDIVTDSGSIGLLSASNAPLGTLSLQAGTIRVANAATLAALGSAGSMQAINALLDAAASNPSNSGYLVAGSIGFDVTQGLFIQNTGLSTSYADRRGFTAGTVTIRTGGPTTQIAVNGQTLDPAGIVVTGLNTVRTLSINGLVPALGGAFDPQSSVNGCVIGFDCTLVPNVRPDKTGLTKPLSPDGTGGSVGIIPLISIAEQQENGSPPLIDEPITGVGNDDLWQDRCAQGQSCESDSNGQAGNRGAN